MNPMASPATAAESDAAQTADPGSEAQDSAEPSRQGTVDEQEPPDGPKPPRFHDMDSLRAAMMLLGLIFHVAWFFLPVWFGHPVSDVKGGIGYLYFFCWVHQFRMQVFFLIAGFFACLLVRKRGLWSFAKNRFLRIVIPLALAMVTVYPLMKFQYLRGGLASGRILSDEPLATQYWEMMTSIIWSQEWPVHLWFLEALILIYVIAWCLRLSFDNLFDRENRLRPRIENWVNRFTRSHGAPILFAVPVAACMYYDTTWFGIDTGPLKPLWAGVLGYWVFFAVGWCLYASPQIIDVFVRRWPVYLIVGSVLSLGLCAQFNDILMKGRTNWFYPLIMSEEVDYPSLRSRLLQASADGSAEDPYRIVWDSLDSDHQNFVRDRVNPTSDQLTGFTMALSEATVFDPGFASRFNAGAAVTGAEAEFDPVANRAQLAEGLNGDVLGYYQYPVGFRVLYFVLYAIASWLMTFAMLGLFRRYLAHPSPAIRYLADSSYWLYLIHLPLQFEFAIWMWQWEINGALKFLIYNVFTFAVLLPTYHFLVRPTWLGVLLNGRMYPLRKALPSET